MTNTPLVSIITVVYNGERFLQQTIDSVYNQSYKNIEYIIIDGGSTDNTLNIINNNEAKITKWISEPDKGLYDAMNKGIKMASGELIGTINSDDWYELDAIKLIVQTYLENPSAEIFHANRYDIKPDGSKIEYCYNPSKFKLKYMSMTLSHPSMFVIKDLYRKYSYNISLSSHADYEFVLKMFLNNHTFIHINKPLINFRLGGVSSNLSFLEDLKQGYYARQNAGLSFLENILAFNLRIIAKVYLLIFKNWLRFQ